MWSTRGPGAGRAGAHVEHPVQVRHPRSAGRRRRRTGRRRNVWDTGHPAGGARYGLGLSAFELGSGYSRQAPFERLARVPLARLVDRTGHNAHLAVLHGREVVYVIEERAPGRPPLVTEVGVRLPAHLTASGRAVLARLPQAQVRALFPDPSAFVRRNELGPASLSALRHLLTEVRRRGYATEEDEITTGFSSVAAAVLDHSAHPIAGVAVTFPGAQVDEEQRGHMPAEVGRVARELTRRVGGVTD
ncbi:IclR family transcriptional regulator [Streptomyces sp. NPDC003487]